MEATGERVEAPPQASGRRKAHGERRSRQGRGGRAPAEGQAEAPRRHPRVLVPGLAASPAGCSSTSPSGGRERLALAIYAISLSALLGTSALYHRVNWKRPSARMWMRRLDHSMIFLLIAGTVTPFALLVVGGTLGTALLIAVWAGAAGRDRSSRSLWIELAALGLGRRLSRPSAGSARSPSPRSSPTPGSAPAP